MTASIAKVTKHMAFSVACSLIAVKGMSMTEHDIVSECRRLYGNAAPGPKQILAWAEADDWDGKLREQYARIADRARENLEQQGVIDIASRGAELHHFSGKLLDLTRALLTGGRVTIGGQEIDVPRLKLRGHVDEVVKLSKVLVDVSTHAQLLLGEPTSRAATAAEDENDPEKVRDRLDDALQRKRARERAGSKQVH